MMQSKFQALTKTTLSHIMDSDPSTPQPLRDRILLSIMDPSLRTFTITMPTVGAFLFGTALCCFCCFKYGLQRWYEKTLTKARTKSRVGITYADSLQHKKDQLERALNKITKLRNVEPQRTDLKYEAVALKEGIRMLNEHLRNSQRYADYCESMRRPSREAGMYSTRASFDAQQESNFVNPMFSSQQAFNSGYMIDPVKLKDGAGQIGTGSPSSSDEECHNPKHKELELYLMSTGGTIRPSLLKFPESVTSTNLGFPSGHVQRSSRAGSPLRRQEIDGEGRSIDMSPGLQREMGSSIESAAPPNRAQTIPDAARYVQPRAGMSQTWQPSSNEMPNFSSITSPSNPNFSPGGPNFNPGPISGDTTYRGSQPRVSP